MDYATDAKAARPTRLVEITGEAERLTSAVRDLRDRIGHLADRLDGGRAKGEMAGGHAPSVVPSGALAEIENWHRNLGEAVQGANEEFNRLRELL